MTSTTNVLLDTPAHGSNVDVWDATPINANSGILDALFGTVTTKGLTNANVTLSTTETRVNIIRFTGTLTGNCVITLGAIIKSWIVENNTIGLFTITVQGNPGTGNVVGLPPGACQIYWDGTNVSFINLGRVGEYWDYVGSATPSWITACTIPPALQADGGTFSAVTYPKLNELLGGNTLPDTRGRTRFALNGGTGRLTTGGGIDGNTRFAGGGIGTGLGITQANFPSVNFNLSISDTRTWGLAYTAAGAASGGNFLAVTTTAGGLVFPVGVQSGSISGTAASGGSATPLTSVSPGVVHGVTLIWAR